MTAATAARVRPAADADIEAVAAIYGDHVEHGTASFELSPPSRAEMAGRLHAAADIGLPYMVACVDDAVCGFGALSPYRPRPGYAWTVEDSIYVKRACWRRGIGRALLDHLVSRATGIGYRQMIAVIGDSANTASITLHARLGFSHVGTLADVGFKHGRWLDVVVMQRALGEGATTLPDRAPGT